MTTTNALTSAQQTLVLNNIQYAENVAKHYRHLGMPLKELYSEAYWGLCEAASRFNPNEEVPFTAYAYVYIFKYVQLYLNEYINHQSKAQTIDLYYDNQDGTYECRLQVKDPYDMEQHACARSNRKYLLRTLRNFLTTREYDVICRFYGFDGIEQDEQEIAKCYGVSRQAINLSKNSALKKIGQHLPKQWWSEM